MASYQPILPARIVRVNQRKRMRHVLAHLAQAHRRRMLLWQHAQPVSFELRDASRAQLRFGVRCGGDCLPSLCDWCLDRGNIQQRGDACNNGTVCEQEAQTCVRWLRRAPVRSVNICRASKDVPPNRNTDKASRSVWKSHPLRHR